MKLYVIDSVRTNNFNDEQVMEKIQGLWKEVGEKVNLQQQVVYGVYYDYASNYKGDYSLSLATEKEYGDSIIEIPSNVKYEVFKVNGAEEQGILKVWSRIWEQEESGLLKRAYTYDYEKYDLNGNIEIYIAVRA